MKLIRLLFLGICCAFAFSASAQVTMATVDPGPYTPGSTISALFTLDPATCIRPGNVFELYLSDASGNFGTEVRIGTYNGFYSAFVNGVIPAGTAPGTNYRLRIKSTIPPAIVSLESNTFEIKAGAVVTAGLSAGATLSPEAFGFCSGRTTNNTINLTNQSTATSTVTATVQNQLTGGAPTTIVFDAAFKPFTPQLAHYTAFVKAVMPDGTVSTKTYFIVNNNVNTSFTTSNEPIVCLPGGALQYFIDVSSATGIQNNFPGNTYNINWGDGTSNVYTFCDLQSGTVDHSYTRSSCGQTYQSGSTTINNVFGVNIQVSNSFCGNVGTQVSTIAKVVDITENRFTGPTNGCTNVNVTFRNTSLLGQSPSSTEPECEDINVRFNWYVDGVLILPDVPFTTDFVYAFSTRGNHIVTLSSTSETNCQGPPVDQTICIQDPPVPSFTIPATNCLSTTVTPTNTSVVDINCNNNVTYIWTVSPTNGVSPASPVSTSSATPPTFTFTVPGIYTIGLRISTPNCGPSAIVTHNITINEVRAVTLSPDITLCNIGTFNFTNLPATSPTRTFYTGSEAVLDDVYSWTVTSANGGTYAFVAPADTKYPIIRFDNFDTYTITSTVTNVCGTRTDSQVITFTQSPVPTIAIATNPICYNANANLTGNITGTYTSFQWVGNGVFSVGNGTSSDPANLVTTYTPTQAERDAGSATIILRVNTGLTGTCAVVDESLVINIYPNNTGTNATQTICTGTFATYNPSSSVAGSTFTWTAANADGNAIDFSASGTGPINDDINNTNPTADAVVIYTITPESNGCLGVPYTFTVTVRPRPIVTPTAANATICSGQGAGITLASNLAGVTTYTWTSVSTGGITGNTNNATPTASTSINDILTNPGTVAGTVTYTVTPSTNGCSGTPVAVVVNVEPQPTAPNAGPDQAICNQPTYTLQGNSPAVGTGRWTVVPANAAISFDNDASPTATAAGLQAGNTYTFRWTITGAVSCAPKTDDVLIRVDLPSNGGTSSGSTAVCAGSNSGQITLSGQVGNIVRWESSTDGIAWTSIANTTNTLNYANLTTTTQYRAVVSNGTCAEAPSTITTITVNDPVVAAAAGPNQTLCNATSATLAGNSPSPNTGAWSIISGQSGVTFNDATSPTTNVNGLVAGQTYTFRWTITGSAPCPTSSDDVIIKIDPASNGGTTAGATAVCAGTNSGQITLSGQVGNIVRWESSTDGIAWTPIANTTNTLNYANLTTTTQYRAVAKSGTCAEAPSTVTIITVNDPVVAAAAGPDQNLCNATSATLAGNSPAPNTGAWSIISGQSGVTFDDATSPTTNVNGLVAGQTYTFRWTITGSAPCPTSSDDVIIKIDLPSDGGTTSGSTALCAGTNSGQITLSGQVGNIIRWESSTDGIAWTPIANTTNTLNYANLTTTTQYRAVVRSGSCAEATSTVTIITVNQPVVTAIAGPDQTLCNVNVATLTGNSPAPNTGAWSIISGQSGVTFDDATSPTTNVNGLVAGQTYTFRWTITGSAPCPPSTDDVVIKIDLPTNGGITAGSTTVCAGNSNGQISLSGQVGNVLRWESSTDGFATSTTIASTATSIPYLNLTTTTQYRAVVQNGTCGPEFSTVATVTVNQGAVTADAGPDQTLCNLSSTTLAGNSPGPNAGLWTQISGPSGAVFTDPTLFNTTVTGLIGGSSYIFRWTISGLAPCPATSDDMNVVNLAELTNNTINTPVTTNCYGQTITLIGSTPSGGDGTYTFVWESSPTGSAPWTIISGQTGRDLTVTVTESLSYRRTVISGVCSTISNVLNIVALPPIANNTIAGTQTICYETAPTTITGSQPTGGDGTNYTYSWEQSVDGVVWAAISGANGQHYSPPALTQTTSYRRLVSSAACTGAQQNVSAPVTVTVNPNAEAEFTWTNDTGCVPFTLDANNIKAVAYPDRNATYTWYAGTVQIGTGITFPGYTIPTDNTSVTIRLVVTSSFGCLSDEMSHNFVTRQTIDASFTQDRVSGCGPLTVNFNNTSTSLTGVSFEWFVDGVSVSTNAQLGSYTFDEDPLGADKIYNVMLRVYTACGADDSPLTQITVKSVPRPGLTPDKTFGCSPFDVNFTNTSPGKANNTYVIDFGDGTAPSTWAYGTPITHRYLNNTAEPLDFTVTMTATNECDAVTVTVGIIRVLPNAVDAQLSVDGNSLRVCVGQPVTFRNRSTGATRYDYDFGDGTTFTVFKTGFEDQIYAFKAPGRYTVTLRASNECPSFDMSTPISIEVIETPTANFNADVTTGCDGMIVRFTNNSVGATSYLWDFGDGSPTSNEPSPTHTYTGAARSFTVTLVATNPSGCSDPEQKTDFITIVGPPNANFAVSPAVVISIPDYTFKFTNESTNNPLTYIWTFGDGSSSRLKDPTHTYPDTGKFKVTLRAYNQYGCVDSAQRDVQIIGVPGYTFVPNSFIPGSESVQLQKFMAVGSGMKSWKMSIFNKWGQVLWETTKLEDGKPVEGWDGTFKGVPQPQGIYFWKIEVELINGSEWKGMSIGNAPPRRTGQIYLIR